MNKKINTLILGIAFVSIVTIILGFVVGSSFYFCLKPFIYIGLTIFTYLYIDSKYVVKQSKKYVNQIVIMTIITYMLLYILSGILFGFANNPLVMKGSFFWLNLLYYIPTAICIELIRYRIISNVDKEKKLKYMIILSIVLAFCMSNFSLSMFESLNNFVKMFYEIFVANFVIGLFLCYVDLNGSLFASIIYVLIPIIYNLFASILPNPQWIIPVILKTLLPVISYVFLEKSIEQTKNQQTKKNNHGSFFGIIGVICMIFVILFACGIFRIYPVAIASNSMKPTFSRGDIEIIDKKEQVYEIGDVIQFYGLNDTVFVHRVVFVRKEGNKYYYTTKGDNNDSVDIMEISQDRVIGKSILTIKYLGFPTVWLTEIL